MKRFSLLLIILLAMSAVAQVTDIIVIEEVVSPASTEADDSINSVVDLLVNSSDVLESNASSIVEEPDSGSNASIPEAPLPELAEPLVITEENLTIVEQVEIPAVAPELDDALEVMTDSLGEENITEVVEVPAEPEVVEEEIIEEPELIAEPVEFIVDENLTVIEEVTSPAEAPFVEDALDVMLDNLSTSSEIAVIEENVSLANESIELLNETENVSEILNESVELLNESVNVSLNESNFSLNLTNETLFNISPELNFTNVTVNLSENLTNESVNLTNETINNTVVLQYSEGPIKEITLVNVTNASKLRVETVPPVMPSPVYGTSWTQIYAIDPTNTTFDSGLVEVVASGENLFKCKDWNFDERHCYGSWVLIAEDMVPGNTYYLEIDPSDPAFGEIVATAAIHLDENGTFVSDVFANISSIDDVWTESIFANHTVRVTFEKLLSDGNVIDFVGRTNGSLVDVEIYVANTSTLVGASRFFDTQMHEFIELSGVPSPVDTFDLRIVGLPTPVCEDVGECVFTDSVPLMEFDFINDGAIAASGADGVLAYSEAAITGMRYRQWNKTSHTWTIEQPALNNTAAATWIVVKSSHMFNHQYLLGAIQTDTNVSLQVGLGPNSTIANNTNWTARYNLSFDVPAPLRRSLDIAIEDISGEGVIVYETAANNDTIFNLSQWNGSNLSSTISVNTTNGSDVLWLRAVPRPNSDEVMILALTTHDRLWATLWNGTGLLNTTGFNISASTGISTFEVFDFAWQSNDGGLVVYRQAAEAPIQYRTFNITNRAWSANSTVMTLNSGVPQTMRLCPDSTSNYVGFISSDSTADTNVRIWNGTGIETIPAPPAENGAAEPVVAPANGVDCAWFADGSNATFVFIEAAAAVDDLISYVSYNKTSWSVASLASPHATPSATGGASIEYIDLIPNPVTREIQLLMIDDSASADLFTALLNGTVWLNHTTTRDYFPETSVTTACAGTTLCAGFDWDRFDPAPNITVVAPVNNTNISSGSQVNITVNVTDNLNVSNVTVNVTQPDNSFWRINLTLFQGNRTSGNWSANFTNTTVLGRYNFTACANDTSTHNNWKCISGFFNIANTGPSVSGASLVPAVLFVGQNICLLANVTDSDGVGNVTATIDRPVLADQYVTLLDNVNTCNSIAGDGTYSNLYHTNVEGTHNWTAVNATDSLGNPSATSIGLTFDVLTGGFDTSYNVTPTSSAFHDLSFLNISLINVSDNIRASQLTLLGIDTFMYFNWSLNVSGNINDSNVSIEHRYTAVSPTAILEIRNGSVWQTLCSLTESLSDVTDICDLDGFVNGNASFLNSLQLRTNVNGLVVTQDVDYVYLNVISTDVLPPLVSISIPVNGSSFYLNDTVNITANVTDVSNVSAVFARVTLPNGTNVSVPMLNISTMVYAGNFTNLMLRGNYTVTIIANDTLNNINSSVTTLFRRRSLDVVDFVNMGNSFLNYSTTVVSNISGILNLTINISSRHIRQINVTNHNESSMQSILLIHDEQPVNQTVPGSFASYAIDPVNFSFNNATAAVNATGNDLVYKCTNYNFTEDICEGSWVELADITAGQMFIFTFNSTDPAFLETSAAVDVAMWPINFTTFVIAFTDNNDNDISFRIMQTNGSIIVNTTDVDTTADNTSRVDVVMINTTDFAIAWIDGPNDDVVHQQWHFNGTNVSNTTNVSVVDADVGLNNDVSVAEIGDRYFVCYTDGTDNDATFQGFNNTNGVNVTGIIDVDTAVAAALPLQNLVDCAGVNGTRWNFFFFDDADNDATYNIRSETGASIAGPTDIDADIGETGQVATTNLNRNSSGLLFYDATDADITFAVVSLAGVTLAGPTDMDLTAGTDSRVAAATVRQNDTAAEDLFVLAWQDNASTDIKAAVVRENGSNVTAPFTVANASSNSSLRLIDVTGRDSILNISLCPGRFIVAFTNSSGSGEFKGFFVNGTAWDGTCGPHIITNKTDSPDPVTAGGTITYQILINNTANDTAFNVTVIESYPSGVVFNGSQPSPTSGNGTWNLGNISHGGFATINITVNVSAGLANGTVLNNSYNVTFFNVSGTNSSVANSTTTVVRGVPRIFTNKTDTPDPVINGTTLSYVILINNTGGEIAYNVTVVESYPSNVVFNGSSPVPSVGNNTWNLGTLLNGSFTTINITVNVSAGNGSILNNSYNVTFANSSGQNLTVANSTTTTVQGIGVIVTIKSDTPDPVVKGRTLSYSILVNNTGDEIAYNVTLVELYPGNVVFNGSTPVPTSGNNTWSLGNLSPNQSTTVNITVNVSRFLGNGSILTNFVNVTFANLTGANRTVNDTEATTVIGFPEIFTNKTDTPDPVTNGTTLSYRILINNTGDEIAYNVTVVEGYPVNVTFNGSSPSPTSGNNTWSLGNLSSNQSFTINITVNVSSAAGNGSILNNTYNVTFANNSGTNLTITNSTTTTVSNSTPGIVVTGLTPVNGTSFLLNDTVNISANVTSSLPVSTVLAFLTFPNGSNTTITLTLLSGTTYAVNFTNLTLRGQYNITIFANDTSNNINNTANTSFIRRSLNVIDVVNVSNQFWNYTVAVMSNVSGVLNISVNISGTRVQTMNITLHNETSVYSIMRIEDPYPLTELFFVEYAINGSDLNFTNATAVVTAVGDNVLYTCKNYNFTGFDCMDGNWSELANITRGVNYTLFITPTDPGFLETSAAVDVALAPINTTTFIIAFVDLNQSDISFRIMNANGSIIVNTTDVDTTADNTSRVDVSMINSSDFVIAWIDGPADDVAYQQWHFNGSNVTNTTNVTVADVDVGLNTDISTAEIGDRYFICYADDVDNDATFQGFNNTNGASIVAAVDVDASLNPELPLQNLLDCAGINNTRFNFFWFDDGDNDATYNIRSEAGVSIAGPTDIDTDIGETGQVATTNLNRNSSGLLWYDSTDQDITFAVVSLAGVTLAGPTDMDTAAGTNSRVAAATVRQNDTATEDLFVLAWQDNASTDIKAAVVRANGSNVTTPFTVANASSNSSLRLIDVTGRDSILNLTLCPGTFVVAFTNSTNQGEFRGFFVNGSSWDGTCASYVNVTKTDSPDPVLAGSQLNYSIVITNNGNFTAFNVTLVESYPANVVFHSSSPVPTSGNNTWSLGNLSPGQSTTVNITLNVSINAANGSILTNNVNVTFANFTGENSTVNDTENTTVLGIAVIVTSKTDSLDPVPNGTTLSYQIFINNTGTEIAYNVTVVEVYPVSGVTFNGSTPVPNIGNNTWFLGNLSPNQSTTINITVNVSAGNGTVLNNSYNVTFANASGQNLTVTNSTTTTVRGIPFLTVQKSDSPDPVVRGQTLTYTILINNTGDEIAYNVTLVELYPGNVMFNGSTPVPTSGNNTWSLGNLLPNQSTTVNITVNVSRFAGNGTILTNFVNVTFSNFTGTNSTVNDTENTTVIGFPEVFTNKSDTPDPVANGSTLSYQITINNTGDEIAYNVTVVETYPISGVTFNGSSPAPNIGNNTWFLGNLSPNQSFTINITVNVSAANGTILNNSYNVTFANNSGTNLTITNSTTTTVQGAPLVVTIKSDTPDPVVRGQTLSYQIFVNNTGDAIAYNVTLVETYPGNIVFNGSTPSPTSGNNTWNLGNLSPNQSTTVNITVNVSLFLGNGSILTNFVNVTFSNLSGTNSTVNDSETTTVIGFPEVFTNKSDTPDPVPNGTTLAYQITINNTGDEIAYNVTVVETYPVSGVTFNGSSPVPTSGNNTWSLGNLLPNQSSTINITVNVSAANGTVLNNSYNVTFANNSGTNLTVTNSTTTTVRGIPFVVSIKSDSPDPVVRGQTLSYQIFVNNTGDEVAYNVTLVETYPGNIVFNGSTPVPSVGNNTWFLGNLSPNQSTTVNITVNVSRFAGNGTILTNFVNVTFSNFTGTNSTVNDTESTTVVGFPEVFANKSDSPDPIFAGNTLTYRIVINNTGDEIAYNVTVVEGYPVNVTFNGSSPVPTSGNNTWSLGNLLPNQSFTINITVNVSIGTDNGSILNNTFNVTFANNSGTNTTITNSTNTTVLNEGQNATNVTVTKTDNPDPVLRGTQLNYTITINNTGNATAINVTVVEGYPSGVVFHNSSPSPTSGNNTWFLGNLSANSSTTINITVNVSSALANGTILNNTVNVSHINTTGSNATTNTSALTTVRGARNLTITKTDNPDPVGSGSTLSYQITINNTGDDTAFNVTLIEFYPANVTFNGSTPVPSVGNNTWFLGNLSPNQSTTVNITVNVSSTMFSGTLNNTVFANASNFFGTNQTVNTTEFTTVIPAGLNVSNITLTKLDSPDPVIRGQQLNYSIVVNSTGNGTAFNVTIIEGYPSGVVFHNSSPVPTSGNGTFDLGNLSNGTVFIINITVNVSSTVSNGTILNNIVNSTFTFSNGLPGSSTDSETTTVIGFPEVFTNKSDTPDPVPNGTTLAYQITIKNTGDEIAYNVTVVDVYPVSGVTFNGSTPVPTSGNNTWSLGNLLANQSTTINITVNVSAANGTILNNSYNVTFANNSGTNLTVTNSTTTTVRGIPFVVSIKSDSPDPVVRGQTLSYQIFINNTGDEIAYNVTLVENYPANVTFNGSTPVPSVGNNTWFLGNLSPNQSTTVNITVNVSLSAVNGSILTNFVNVTFSNFTGTNSTVNDTETTTVIGFPVINVTKSDSPDPVVNGSNLTYTIVITNNGDEIAYNVTLVEDYPVNLTFNNATPAPSIGNNTWFLGNLSPGNSTTVIIRVTVSSNMTSGILTDNVNVTFGNFSGTNLTVNATANTTVTPFVPPVPPSGGGGGGGGGGDNALICPGYCRDPRYQTVAICRSRACIIVNETLPPPQMPVFNGIKPRNTEGQNAGVQIAEEPEKQEIVQIIQPQNQQPAKIEQSWIGKVQARLSAGLKRYVWLKVMAIGLMLVIVVLIIAKNGRRITPEPGDIFGGKLEKAYEKIKKLERESYERIKKIESEFGEEIKTVKRHRKLSRRAKRRRGK